MKREKQLETILTIATGLVLLYLLFHVRALLISALALGLTGLFSPYLSQKISQAWMKLSEGLGFVSSKILLSLVYFLFLLPVALLQRLFSKDKLQLKKSDTTLYRERNHAFRRKDLENPW